MKILVTGGAGFLGSHLCKALIERGEEVICVDNLYTGSKDNIRELMDNPKFTFKEHDIINPIDMEVDQIYNLACPASPPHYKNKPVFTTMTCTMGMLNMLELAKRNNARILQASTSEVYGNPLEHPQNEEYWGSVNCFGPRSCYDEGKRVAETLMYDYHHMHGVDIRIVRIFNTYGPNMNLEDGRVVTNFIVHALQGKPCPVYQAGKTTRSFCYVSDLIRGILLLMDSDVTTPVNLGNPGEYSIKELAEKVCMKIPSNCGIKHVDFDEKHVYSKKNDPQKRQPDIRKAKELLGWEPKVDLDGGIDLSIPYFKRMLNL
ncbi:MAG: UDP-glucuronic acid decarboxylase family protein [Candidatus Nanoarchaeia archaeon]